jgi:hypothetical protein
LSVPGGTPASSKHFTSSTQAPGVSSEALTMIEQPAASAAAILRTGVSVGKFHGVNAATTPTGSVTTICRTDGFLLGMMRP